MALPLSRAALVRVIPFVAFMALLALRGAVPADGSWGIDARWIYGATVVVVGGLLLWYFATLSQVNVVYGSLTTAIVVLLSLEIAAALLLLGAQVISEHERIGRSDPNAPPKPFKTESVPVTTPAALPPAPAAPTASPKRARRRRRPPAPPG